MEFLLSVLENSEFSILTAFILGLMTAISPCPLATNITAIGYINKNLEDKKRVFVNGLFYTLGRAVSYTALGLLFYFGADQFEISGFLQEWGEKIPGSVLIVIGLFMLGVINLNVPGMSKFSEKLEKKKKKTFADVLFLGVLFALAFCPYSGVLFFGMLIPITISSTSGLFLPFVFAIGTGLPVIIIAWLIAYSFSNIGNFYNNIKKFEFWFRKAIAILFIIVGIYYIYIFYIQPFFN